MGTQETGDLFPLAVSLALGLLVGVERGWREREAEEGSRVAGVRTYGLIGLLGGVSGLLGRGFGLPVPGFAFLGLAAALTAAHVIEARRTGDLGITSLTAGLVTFALGALATLGRVPEAAAAAVVTVLLLGAKPTLHRWLRSLSGEELRAAFRLLLVSVVMLPVLPDRGMGPWEALNPREIWWMVVLISGISFVGYFAMKMGGARRGAMLTALLAGLTSSTALTLHFARLARRQPGSERVLGPGILLACGTMFPRMVVVATVIDWRVGQALALPALVMAGVVWAGALVGWLRAERTPLDTGTLLGNPLELRAAVGFGALLAVIMLAARGLQAALGDAGVLLLAAASGIADVDAITLALTRMGGEGIPVSLAILGIVAAAAVNTGVKAVLAWTLGGRTLGLRTSLPLVGGALAGLALAWG